LSKGFTLIEILTTVAIILIIAALAIPSMAPIIERIQLSMAVDTIKHQLICAKTRALGDSKTHCGVHFDTNSTPHGVQLFLDSGSPEHDGVYTKGADQVFGNNYHLPPTILLSIGGTGKKCDIIFRGDGSTKVHGIILTLKTSKEKKKCITVLPSTGKIKVY
jgi:prepilin-type N-terminal cleavage/methylation domain-containing protein